MKRISSKSSARVVGLLGPMVRHQREALAVPRRLTLKQLIHYKSREALRRRVTIVVIEGDHLLCVHNLERLGFDYYG